MSNSSFFCYLSLPGFYLRRLSEVFDVYPVGKKKKKSTLIVKKYKVRYPGILIGLVNKDQI